MGDAGEDSADCRGGRDAVYGRFFVEAELAATARRAGELLLAKFEDAPVAVGIEECHVASSGPASFTGSDIET
jgi:hypothetical protein